MSNFNDAFAPKKRHRKVKTYIFALVVLFLALVVAMALSPSVAETPDDSITGNGERWAVLEQENIRLELTIQKNKKEQEFLHAQNNLLDLSFQ